MDLHNLLFGGAGRPQVRPITQRQIDDRLRYLLRVAENKIRLSPETKSANMREFATMLIEISKGNIVTNLLNKKGANLVYKRFFSRPKQEAEANIEAADLGDLYLQTDIVKKRGRKPRKLSKWQQFIKDGFKKFKRDALARGVSLCNDEILSRLSMIWNMANKNYTESMKILDEL